ncbi:hypothetical protein [Flammeovirga aprica]|uniref:Uncharacterized protein n=1 Tax=Flammeovirga aprica JL-4 TaxID=694437 RepID=A0A7X9RW89_9BACT|nr:hypothetical protein [Flammeovirga aprica]NME69886.1 hypothetical protein [Flammeovirga aprica JL-4]
MKIQNFNRAIAQLLINKQLFMHNLYLFIISTVLLFSNNAFAQTDHIKGVLKTNQNTLKGYVRMYKSVGHVVKKRFNPSKSDIRRQSYDLEETQIQNELSYNTPSSFTAQRAYYFPMEGEEQNIYFTRDLSEPEQRLESYRCKSFEDEKGNFYEVVTVALEAEEKSNEEGAKMKTTLMGLRIETGIVSIYQVRYRDHAVYILKRDHQDEVITLEKKEIKAQLQRFMFDDKEIVEMIDEEKKWDIVKVMNIVNSYNIRNLENIPN